MDDSRAVEEVAADAEGMAGIGRESEQVWAGQREERRMEDEALE